MIIHIALFKWKDDVTKDQVDEIMNDIRSLKSKIDVVINLYCGKNFSKWAKGYTHAVVVEVKDKKALDAYRNHPAHIPVAKKVEELEKDSIGLDFEV